MKKKSPKKLPPEKLPLTEEDVDFDTENEEEEKPSPKKKHKGIVALRHQKLLDSVIEGKAGKGRTSLYQTMIDQGYSESYARAGTIKSKKTWQQMIEERLHDDKLSNIHAQLLVAKKIDYIKFHPEITDDQIYQLMESVGSIVKLIVHGISETHVYFWCADNRIRKDAIELAYKVMGKMAPEKFEMEVNDIRKLSDEELADKIRKAKAKFKKTD